ncbi:MAG: glycosyltransferase [Flavobacteriales bacterium]
MFDGARILVAPLDWGLGHAARCIPVIRALLSNGAVPIVGADGGPAALLRSEFPELEHVHIPGMTVRYSKGNNQLWSMARQFPAMLRSVREEAARFDQIRRKLHLDAVISDQRFGIRSPDLPSILITHQVFPFTPVAQRALRKLNLRHMARFDRCWIMDEPDTPGLAGDLSHGEALPPNARFIGPLSRMATMPTKGEADRFAVVAVISGPEPQRTILDGMLTEQLQRIEGEHLLVRGLPSSQERTRHTNLTTVAHLSGTELAAALRTARWIISRSGYTTLMDLTALGRTALIIPTPGQAEQEYLGQLHARTGRFAVQHQDHLDLIAGIAQLEHIAEVPAPRASSLLDEALSDLAGQLH